MGNHTESPSGHTGTMIWQSLGNHTAAIQSHGENHVMAKLESRDGHVEITRESHSSWIFCTVIVFFLFHLQFLEVFIDISSSLAILSPAKSSY